MREILDKIPTVWQAVAALFAAAALGVGFITFHADFVTVADAAERDKAHNEQIILLRVQNLRSERRTLLREKKKAILKNEAAEIELLKDDINAIDMEVDRLCEQVEKC